MYYGCAKPHFRVYVSKSSKRFSHTTPNENCTIDALKHHFWVCVKKLLTVPQFQLLWKLYYGCIRCHFQIFERKFFKKCVGTISIKNYTMDEPTLYFWYMCEKVTKSTLVPPSMKIAIRMLKNPICGYMCKNVVNGALVTPVLKIMLRIPQNIIFGFMCLKVAKSAMVSSVM